jgi:hypothetical protein
MKHTPRERAGDVRGSLCRLFGLCIRGGRIDGTWRRGLLRRGGRAVCGTRGAAGYQRKGNNGKAGNEYFFHVYSLVQRLVEGYGVKPYLGYAKAQRKSYRVAGFFDIQRVVGRWTAVQIESPIPAAQYPANYRPPPESPKNHHPDTHPIGVKCPKTGDSRH